MSVGKNLGLGPKEIVFFGGGGGGSKNFMKFYSRFVKISRVGQNISKKMPFFCQGEGGIGLAPPLESCMVKPVFNNCKKKWPWLSGKIAWGGPTISGFIAFLLTSVLKFA
jgi:hypothetical protein